MKRHQTNNLILTITIVLILFTLPLSSLACDMELLFNNKIDTLEVSYQYFSYGNMTDFLIKQKENYTMDTTIN